MGTFRLRLHTAVVWEWVDIVNRLVPRQMHLKPGLVVQAMVLDTLSGRTPLYRVEDFMAEQDVELLLGKPVAATTFNDTNIARSMDAIFEAEPGYRCIENIFS